MRKDLTITKKDILSAPILIIDDEIVNTEVLSGFLEFKGFTNYTAENYPERGIELYRENDYAIVLLDINMPILNGFEVMQKFAEIDKPQAP
ncbi:MAG: response regulator, partial [Gammaproteobacteria bacterium]|nr:response regulator [Gammaproteobacteria bacterium]